MANSQLHVLTGPCFEMPLYVGHNGELKTQAADSIPIMFWPDGRWCAPANRYMREAFEKGLSRRNRGGSLAVAAAHLGHFLRFLWARQVDPIDLSDNQFREFIAELRNERCPRDPSRRQRDDTTVIAIGRTCLSFLLSVARHYGDDDFIHPSGRIRAEVHEHRPTTDSDRNKSAGVRRYWHHPAFPNPEPQRKRMPISTASIEQLRAAVGVASKTSHQRTRRHVMLKLFEVTGARRGEIALVKVADIMEAAAMQHPMLRMPTLKKRGGRLRYRMLPISRSDIAFLKQYIEVHRRSVLTRKRHKCVDHGILLINENTGEPLVANTITQEVHLLARKARIEEKACPHMFRHRFLTKLFVALIEQHKLENADVFRRLLLDGETLKRKVSEWTDHTDMASLDRYIDLAFEEVGNFQRVHDLAFMGVTLDSFLGTIDAELEAVRRSEQPALILGRLSESLQALRNDLASVARA
ncbi:site-specific integrase [Stenotrophomonas terrae]|uniref:tyrosine-type recombinase/integrase n=1 Tax=Stenotrophomonas terrae TaxID=405446 RepID=UPI00320B1A91